MRTALMIGCLAALALAAVAQENSALWGRDGEAWDPAGRLPDVSFAGACGERPLPKVPAVANVRDFGAKGDGATDDTAAFLSAIAKAEKGAVLIPPGRYRISSILEIKYPAGFGPPSLNLVGVQTRERSRTNVGGRWFEVFPPGRLQPANLHEAQRARRLGVR